MSLKLALGPALEARGLSLKDLADRTHFDLETLEAIERGRYDKFRLSSLDALRCAIGCEVGELFTSELPVASPSYETENPTPRG